VPTASPANLKAFVRRHTRLVDVADVPGMRIHAADDVTRVWHATELELALSDPPLPYWAFTWSGGLAISRYLIDHPDVVANRSVLDLGAGSGICGIVAARLGADSVQAADVDPLARAAIAVNARANDVRIGVSRSDVLESEPPDVDVVLAGDVCYEETMGRRMIDWLRTAADQGARVLLGDPGRAYLPPGLERLASYRVRTSTEVEEAVVKPSAVFAVCAAG
jgi:predicted nicotinamide N-methyase